MKGGEKYKISIIQMVLEEINGAMKITFIKKIIRLALSEKIKK